MTTPACNLTLDVTPSRQLALIQAAAHLIAGLCLLLINISVLWLLCGYLLIALHGVYVWSEMAWLRRLRQVHYCAGRYRLRWTDGKEQVANGGGYFVTPVLVILSLQMGGRRRLLPLFRDSCDADNLRRLRVILRTGAATLEQ